MCAAGGQAALGKEEVATNPHIQAARGMMHSCEQAAMAERNRALEAETNAGA